MSLSICTYKSPVGLLYLVASDQGLQGVYKKRPVVKSDSTKGNLKVREKILKQTQTQLDQYFKGQRNHFDLALDFQGTAFQKKVWNALLGIPFGVTASYKDVAHQIRNPKAVRAVGSANGKNPICIIVPCHRVIAADGSIGGYSGGLKMKKQLLQIENSSTHS